MWRTVANRRARRAPPDPDPDPTAPRCAREAGQPRLVQAPVDDVEQRPDRALGQPRVRLGLDAGGGGHGVRDEPPRRREADVRAHPVGAAGARAEASCHPLRQPPLHPARRDGDDLGRERVGQRLGQQVAERLDQAVGPFCSMDVKHVMDLAAVPSRYGSPRSARV
jgi:hypothetical protein